MKERKDKQPIWLENRPNRNVKSLDQSKDDGFEVGDGGRFVNNLEQEIDNDLYISRLTGKQQEVARLLYKGYNQLEIASKLCVSQQAVARIKKRIKKNLPF